MRFKTCKHYNFFTDSIATACDLHLSGAKKVCGLASRAVTGRNSPSLDGDEVDQLLHPPKQ
jgi:hypothetical protein